MRGRGNATQFCFIECVLSKRREIFCKMDVQFLNFESSWKFGFRYKMGSFWGGVRVGNVEGRESGLIIDPKSVGCCIVCAGFGSFVAVSLNIQLFPRSTCVLTHGKK
mmetsp:Transcript_7498/g.7705  ORF Transcript_7498/g.7705 Transcript_7498/m.7705 type:complete len:107 (-) Transcript_7498:139-459(-)